MIIQYTRQLTCFLYSMVDWYYARRWMMILITFCGETFFFPPFTVSILPRRAIYAVGPVDTASELVHLIYLLGRIVFFLGRQAGRQALFFCSRHCRLALLGAGERASVCVYI